MNSNFLEHIKNQGVSIPTDLDMLDKVIVHRYTNVLTVRIMRDANVTIRSIAPFITCEWRVHGKVYTYPCKIEECNGFHIMYIDGAPEIAWHE